MLTLAAIKENPEEIIRKLAKKHFDAKDAIERTVGFLAAEDACAKEGKRK